MPPDTVVRHNLTVTPEFDLTGMVEPIPMRVISAAVPLPALAKPPVDTQINPPTIFVDPYQSVGKMFMKFDPLTSPKAGSGWVVAPRAFITAGHCVYYKDLGGWVEEIRFCPRFSLECSGTLYVVKAVFTLQGWIDTTDPDDAQYDLGACLVTEAFASTEPPLQFDTSPLPAFNFAAIGYPGRPIPGRQFNGKRMWKSVGGSLGVQQGMHFAENDFTQGASGGPWCEPDNNWVVSGLTAARGNNDPNVAVSPLFGQGFQNLYNAVKNL